jgi:hypothetical protein
MHLLLLDFEQSFAVVSQMARVERPRCGLDGVTTNQTDGFLTLACQLRQFVIQYVSVRWIANTILSSFEAIRYYVKLASFCDTFRPYEGGFDFKRPEVT